MPWGPAEGRGITDQVDTQFFCFTLYRRVTPMATQTSPQQAKSSFQEYWDDAVDYSAETIKEAPATSILVGFGAGLLLGAFTAKCLMDTMEEPEKTMTDKITAAVRNALHGMVPSRFQA
jgi:hypothetical protein